MKLRIFELINEESYESAFVNFSPVKFDFLTVTPSDIKGMKDCWKSVSLKCGEELKIKAEFGDPYSHTHIIVKQSNRILLSISALDIVALSFTTIGGNGVSIESVVNEI